MNKEQKNEVRRTIFKGLSKFYSHINFKIDVNKSSLKIVKKNVSINLNIGGNYGQFVTINPTIRILNKETLNSINKAFENGFHTNGFFTLSKILSYEVTPNAKKTPESLLFQENDIKNVYKIFNKKDIYDLCINHILYMAYFGLYIAERFQTDDGLYDFFLSILTRRDLYIKEGDKEKNANLIFLDISCILTFIMIGIKHDKEDLIQNLSLVHRVYESNNYIMSAAFDLVKYYRPELLNADGNGFVNVVKS